MYKIVYDPAVIFERKYTANYIYNIFQLFAQKRSFYAN